MINLNQNPEAVYSLNDNDVVVVDGIQYTAALKTLDDKSDVEIYLWRSIEFGRGVDAFKYVKTDDFSRIAWMSKAKLVEILESGNYIAE